MKKILFIVLIAGFAGCHGNSSNDETAAVTVQSTPVMTFMITNVYPHNTSSYTEGLEWHDSTLYESTGNYGPSKLARVSLTTGKHMQEIGLSKDYFGEGITVFNGKIYQLTYNEHKCFVYDFKTFKKIKEFEYEGEGWGMTNDGKYLIMDNKSDSLIYRDPETFAIVKVVRVTENGAPVDSINELEYVDGFIYSNIWLTNYIIKIDPATGKVLGKADFSYMLNKYAPGAISDDEQRTNSVLNGIAYDNANKRFFVTGKNWPKLFEIKFN